MKCSNCGKEVKDEEAIFCPHCAKPIKTVIQKHTPLPMTAGILTIIAACLIIAMGIVCVVEALTSYGQGYGYGYIAGVNIFLWVTGIIGLIAFPTGLVGGIFSLKRRYVAIPIFGISLLITSGIFLAVLNTSGALLRLPIWIFGSTIVIFSVLSIIFVAISKEEFS